VHRLTLSEPTNPVSQGFPFKELMLLDATPYDSMEILRHKLFSTDAGYIFYIILVPSLILRRTVSSVVARLTWNS